MIDKAHLAKFGEEREARRARVLEERAAALARGLLRGCYQRDKYDSPPKIGDDRKQAQR